MAKRQAGLFQLSDAYLTNLSKNAKMLQLFPFFNRLYKQSREKTCCGGVRKRIIDTKQFNTVRMQLINEPKDKLQQLKDFLGVSRLSITYRDPKGGLKSKVV